MYLNINSPECLLRFDSCFISIAALRTNVWYFKQYIPNVMLFLFITIYDDKSGIKHYFMTYSITLFICTVCMDCIAPMEAIYFIRISHF